MSTYTPRPGSKTEAAVAYLRAHGGAATAIALSDAIDSPRKNIPAQFRAAIDRGLLEACDLPEGMGYRLVGPDAPGTPRAAPETAEPRMAWPAPEKQHPKPGVGKNPGSDRSVATGQTSAEAPAVTAQATPRPKPERRETGPAPATAAAGDVDPVEPSPHYTSHTSVNQCMRLTDHMGFNLGAAITCLWQADLNGTEQDDLRNALWYISRELQKRERATTLTIPARDGLMRSNARQ